MLKRIITMVLAVCMMINIAVPSVYAAESGTTGRGVFGFSGENTETEISDADSVEEDESVAPAGADVSVDSAVPMDANVSADAVVPMEADEVMVTAAAAPSGFADITSNSIITNAVGKTTFPVYYVFSNGAIVSGDDIGMSTTLKSTRLNSAATVVAAGADKTAFESNLKKALGITAADTIVTVKRAKVNNSLVIQLAFTAANGQVYYSSANGLTTTDANTTNVRNEINNNHYMLTGKDKILIPLTLKDNASAKYSESGITYGTITNSTVKATATALNADTYGSSTLPETVSIAGVPYTVADGITTYIKDQVTYTINRTNKTAAVTVLNADKHGSSNLPQTISVNGVKYSVVDNITTYVKDNVTYTLDRTKKYASTSNESAAAAKALNVNGITFIIPHTNTYSGTITYKGVTYTVDTSKTDGAPQADASSYRAAAIGAGTTRTITYRNDYQKSTDPEIISQIQVRVPLTKVIESNRETSLTVNSVKGDQFVFDIKPGDQNPADGAVVVRTDGTAGTSYTIPAEDVLREGEDNGTSMTASYSLDGDDSPWSITFTKTGTYTFEITEQDSKATGITYDKEVDTLTFHVVKDAGSLHLSEAYRSDGDQIESTEVTSENMDPLALERQFNTSYVWGAHHNTVKDKASVSATGNTATMELEDDISGVITTKFTFDFSRSFEITGKMMVPDSDAVAIAFHGYEALPAYRWDCNNGFDNFHYGNGNRDKELRILRYGYIPPNADLEEGFLFNIVSRNLDHLRGWYAYKVENNVRIPYEASSGLNGDVKKVNTSIAGSAKSYESFANSEENNGWTAFKVKFTCRNSENGLGTLQITAMGKTVEFNNFNASDILGEDVWQNAHFSLGTSVQDNDIGGLVFSKGEYTDSLNGVDTSFWADRNKDGVYETQVNTTNSPAIPGESILVRHTITRKDSVDSKFFENVIIRKLQDVTSGEELTGTDAVSYQVGSIENAIVPFHNGIQAYNTDELSDGMKIAVFNNTAKTNFEYKITAPSEADHTVVESALFGQPPFKYIYTNAYGFRTEKIAEQKAEFTNRVTFCTVNYDVNGGAFSDENAGLPETMLSGTEYTVISDVPTRTNYAFDGWTDGTNTYRAGDTVIVASDVTLTAKWVEVKPIKVQVKYFISGAKGGISNAITLKDTFDYIPTSASLTADELQQAVTETYGAEYNFGSTGGSLSDMMFDRALTPDVEPVPDKVRNYLSDMIFTDGKWMYTTVDQTDPRLALNQDGVITLYYYKPAYVLIRNNKTNWTATIYNFKVNGTEVAQVLSNPQGYHSYIEDQDQGLISATDYLNEENPAFTIAPGSQMKFMLPGAADDAYELIMGFLDVEYQGQFRAILSDSGTDQIVNSQQITTDTVSGNLWNYTLKGTVKDGNVIIDLDPYERKDAYIRVQNYSSKSYGFRLIVGEGYYNEEIRKQGSSNPKTITARQDAEGNYYYDFALQASSAENNSEMLWIPQGEGLSYQVRVFDGDTDITDALEGNGITLDEGSDPVDGVFAAGPAYSWTDANTNSYMQAIKKKALTDISFIDANAPLTITKKVMGEMGNTSKEFTFRLDVDGAKSMDSYKTLKGSSEGSIKSGESFKLKDGESITINLPKEKTILLEETDAEYYTTTVETSENLSELTDVTDGAESAVKSTSFKIRSEARDASIMIVNTLDDVAPTGVTITYLPYLLILIAGMAIIAVIFSRRRRTEE